MSELFERAVKAFQAYDEMHIRPTDEGLVRAVLSAVEEPTYKMLAAGASAAEIGNIEDIWRAMHKAMMEETITELSSSSPQRDTAA